LPPQHDGFECVSVIRDFDPIKGILNSKGSLSVPSLAEIEAKEACTWLRAAGFPQYAQLYEDGLFPIEIVSVTRDHDFLDRDAIEALCSEDSDEEEPCAISGFWTFQRDSKRWSRLEELDVFFLPGGNQAPFPQVQRPSADQGQLREGLSSESVLTDLSEQPEVASLHSSMGEGGIVDGATSSDATPDSLSDGHPHSPLETTQGRSTRSRAKSFLKRMESIRLRSATSNSKKKNGGGGRPSKLEISGPVIKEGLDDDKLRRLNCVDISSSSQSEASSGSAVSTPSPVARTRSQSTAAGANKRGGMYLEGFDPLSEGVIFFYLPEGHKPGTFPKALDDGKQPPQSGNDENRPLAAAGRLYLGSRCQTRRGSTGSADSRLSFYDNVPNVAYQGEEDDEDNEEGEGPKLEEVLERVNGLQRFVNAWTDRVAAGEEDDEEEEEEGDSDSTDNGSDQDSTGNPLGEREREEREREEAMRERRDSGVGASLTRSNRSLRWPSFQSSHRPSHSWAQRQMGCQSVLQMNLLQKLCLLQLTALLEKHTPTNKHGFSWAVPKFMKRIKVRDYKDRNVFGVPLLLNVQRTGQPLPQSIQQAMRYLRSQCLDQVGLFRKSGVKSRIQALRQMNETCGADGGGVSYEGQSAYDVADMLKQYFRDLPEPLLTSKLTEEGKRVCIGGYIKPYDRLSYSPLSSPLLSTPLLSTPLLSSPLLSFPLLFLSLVDMTNCPKKQPLGKPDQRDLNENLAATNGLAHMIQECRKLFRIPEEMSRCRNSYQEQALIPLKLEELGGSSGGSSGGDGGAGGPMGCRTYLQDSLDALLKEAKDKFKGYDSCSTPELAELAYKKVWTEG
uniref:DLC1 Rho GTPase activating protein n=1 Tax=Hucho hucho TaxID=62062 RepID=A0A4W5K7N9_9TELE